MIDVWVVVSTRANLDLGKGPCIGCLNGLAIDKAHRRGGKEQPAKVLLGPEVDDFGAVRGSLGEALAIDLELADGAQEGASLIALAAG